MRGSEPVYAYKCYSEFGRNVWERSVEGSQTHRKSTLSLFPLSRLLSVYVESNLLLPIRNRDISFRRRDDDGLSRCGGSKLLGEIHPDGQRRSLDSHLNVLHDDFLPTGSTR